MKERKTGIGRRKFYIAYGSNLDMDQMRRRCPTARPYYPYCSGCFYPVPRAGDISDLPEDVITITFLSSPPCGGHPDRS